MIPAIILLAILISYFFAVFPRMSEKERIRKLPTSMFAHRGYHDIRHRIPENSLAAFKAALVHGYGIELDLHLSRDGKLVVFHDDTLERLCGCQGTVEELTYEELSACRLLDTAEKIPLLQDVLSVVDGSVPLLIELKIPGRSLKICEKAYELLRSYPGFYMIQSFNTFGLRWFRINAPHVLRGQLASHLTAETTKEAWIFKFIVQNLFCNFIGRPDFISYKFSDLPQVSVLFLKHVLRMPIAVWTLATCETLKRGVSCYAIQIFEKHGENY